MSTSILNPQGNSHRGRPTPQDRNALVAMGSLGPNDQQNQSNCLLTMIECGARKIGPYPAGQTATPRIRISWSAFGRGTLSVTFDAERGGSFALTGNSLTMYTLFDDYNPAFDCPEYDFWWNSSHAYAAGRNCSIFSRAIVIPPESSIRSEVPQWAYSFRVFGSIAGSSLALHPDDAGALTVGTYTIPATSSIRPRSTEITSQDRFYTVSNPAVGAVRVHLCFEVCV